MLILDLKQPQFSHLWLDLLNVNQTALPKLSLVASVHPWFCAFRFEEDPDKAVEKIDSNLYHGTVDQILAQCRITHVEELA
jgi:Mg2+ and Co2+ transporter CorA